MTETSNQPQSTETPNENLASAEFTHSTEKNDSYEQAMLDAFVQKPSKIPYYQKALNKMMVTGSPNLQWYWSWWGFFGGWIFLLYRKAYLAALVAFLITSAISFIPFGTIVGMVVLGGVAPFFIVKRYAMLKQQIENRYDSQEERLNAMTEIGGFHNWVAWAAGIFYAFVILGLLVISIIDPSSLHH